MEKEATMAIITKIVIFLKYKATLNVFYGWKPT